MLTTSKFTKGNKKELLRRTIGMMFVLLFASNFEWFLFQDGWPFKLAQQFPMFVFFENEILGFQ